MYCTWWQLLSYENLLLPLSMAKGSVSRDFEPCLFYGYQTNMDHYFVGKLCSYYFWRLGITLRCSLTLQIYMQNSMQKSLHPLYFKLVNLSPQLYTPSTLFTLSLLSTLYSPYHTPYSSLVPHRPPLYSTLLYLPSLASTPTPYTPFPIPSRYSPLPTSYIPPTPYSIFPCPLQLY